MKSKFLAALTISLMIFLFSGCSGNPFTPDPTPTMTPSPNFTPTPTSTNTPTPTMTPTPTPSPFPRIVTDVESNTVVVLHEYKHITLTSVSDEAVQAEVSKMLSQYVTDKVVDRPAQLGDRVMIYYVGKIDGLEFEGGSYEAGDGYEVILGSHTFIDTFEEQLVGSKAGDQVVVNVTFPDDYLNESLRGVAATFDVTVNHVLEIINPEFNDQFALEHSSFKTADEYFAHLKSELNMSNFNRQLNSYFAENFEVSGLSPSKLSAFRDSMFDYYYSNAAAYSPILQLDIDTVLNFYFHIPSVDVLTQLCDLAANDYIRFTTCLEAIAIYENISVSDPEFELWLRNATTDYGYDSTAELLEDFTEDDLKHRALYDKVVDFLIENADMIEQ